MDMAGVRGAEGSTMYRKAGNQAGDPTPGQGDHTHTYKWMLTKH